MVGSGNETSDDEVEMMTQEINKAVVEQTEADDHEGFRVATRNRKKSNSSKKSKEDKKNGRSEKIKQKSFLPNLR